MCLFVLFGLIVLAVIGPSPRTSDYEETRAKKRMEKLKTLHEESQKELTTYAWVDKNKGVARIPIDRAMEVTVADLAQKKPAPAGPDCCSGRASSARRSFARCATRSGDLQLARRSRGEGWSAVFGRRVAFSSNSTITTGACFSRTSHYAMNTQHFDRAS